MSVFGAVSNSLSYLAHDSDGSFSGGLSHSMLHQVKHVLVVQEADQVEGAKTGCTPQSKVSDHHGATGRTERDTDKT